MEVNYTYLEQSLDNIKKQLSFLGSEYIYPLSKNEIDSLKSKPDILSKTIVYSIERYESDLKRVEYINEIKK